MTSKTKTTSHIPQLTECLLTLNDVGTVTVTGETTATPGLVITPEWRGDRGGLGLGFGNRLTHAPTGLMIPTGWASPRTAAEALGSIGIDWLAVDRAHFSTEQGKADLKLVYDTLRGIQSTDDNAPHWPKWAGDETQPATSLLAVTLDDLIKDDERRKNNRELHKELRAALPEDLARKAIAHIDAGWSGTYVGSYGNAYLLAVLQRVAPEAADVAARQLACDFEAGDGMGEAIWQWREDLANGATLGLDGFPAGPTIAGGAA